MNITQSRLDLSLRVNNGLPPLPPGPYPLIIADPPWNYTLRDNDETHRGRCKYPSMSIEQIKAMPVGAIASDNAYLFLWTTKDHLRYAFDVCEAWGFEYKSLHTWRKTTNDGSKIRFGVGHYGRNAAEFFIVGRCGGIPTWTGLGLGGIPTVHDAPLLTHSEKPDFLHQIGDRMSDALAQRIDGYDQGCDRVELFARKAREGWTCWGLEVDA